MLNMKRLTILFAGIIVLLSLAVPSRAQQSSDTYFPYPMPPDSITNLNRRCNFLLEHFWDYCDLKKAFSSKAKMRQAFADFLSFMPYADQDKVHEAVATLGKKLDKQPDDLLFLAEEAEAQVMGDSCQYYSEEVFLAFAQAVVNNKRVNSTQKLRYEQQLRQIGGTQPGMIAPDLEYTDRNGVKRHLAADSANIVVLYFNDPDCSDCHLARVKLDANIQMTRLIDKNLVKVVCIYPGDYSPEWAEAVASYPQEWIVGAAPEADLVYHIKEFPSFYLLDDTHKIHAKNYSVDEVLEVARRLDQRVRH